MVDGGSWDDDAYDHDDDLAGEGKIKKSAKSTESNLTGEHGTFVIFLLFGKLGRKKTILSKGRVKQ